MPIINTIYISGIWRVFLPLDFVLRVTGQGQGGGGDEVTRGEPAPGTARNLIELQKI